MSEMRCSNCDTLNRAGARFCIKCGATLAAAVPPTVAWNTPAEYAPKPVYPSQPPARPASRPGTPDYLGLSANFFAWVCAGAFVLLVCLGLPILDFSHDLLDGGLYKQALMDQDVYKRFPDLFAEQMLLSQPGLAKEARIDFNGVGAADWKLIAQELVTPQWMQTQVESLIDDVFAAAKKGASPPDLKIEFGDVTQRMSGEAGFRIYKQVIQSKRACSLDDFFEIIAWIDQDAQSRLPICNIPPDLSEFAAFIAGYENGDEMIRDLLKELPGVVPADLALSEFFSLRMDRVEGWMVVLRTAAWISLALAGLALLGVFVSPAGRRLKGWLLLWGIPLAAAGLFCLVVSFVMPYSLGVLVAGAFRGAIAPGVAKVILEMGRSVSGPGARALGWQAAGMLLLGLGMSGASILFWGMGKIKSAR